MPPKKAQIRRLGPLDDVDPKSALEEFTRLLDEANKLVWKRDFPESDAWQGDVKIALSRFYGGDSEEYSLFDHIWFSPGVYYAGQPDSDLEMPFSVGLSKRDCFLLPEKEIGKAGFLHQADPGER